MTLSDIERAAIEAAMLAGADGPPEPDLMKRLTAFIRAYERAMWRPIEEAPLDGTRIIGVTDGGYMCVLSWSYNDGYWRRNLHEEFPDRWNPTHFRPLPKPEGV